ncbi:hypothetical protein CBL_04023 [Carabus blaptoides fortunei]
MLNRSKSEVVVTKPRFVGETSREGLNSVTIINSRPTSAPIAGVMCSRPWVNCWTSVSVRTEHRVRTSEVKVPNMDSGQILTSTSTHRHGTIPCHDLEASMLETTTLTPAEATGTQHEGFLAIP